MVTCSPFIEKFSLIDIEFFLYKNTSSTFGVILNIRGFPDS